VKFVFERSKKMLSTASTFIRAVVVGAFGIVTFSEPSFGVLAASTCGYVRPPSVDMLIFTFAVLVGGMSVLALFHVTVCTEPGGQKTSVFGEVTRNGPAFVASVSVTSGAKAEPPPPARRSRTVIRKCIAGSV
jgi:hypothetical protein